MFYSENDIKNLNKKIINHFVLIGVFLVVSLIIIIPTLFFINDSTIIGFKILDSVVFSLFLIFLVFEIMEVILPLFRKKEVVNKILASNEIYIDYQKYNIKDIKTINYTEKVKVIELINKKETYYVYLDLDKCDLIDELNKNNRVYLRNNYIVNLSYEENN